MMKNNVKKGLLIGVVALIIIGAFIGGFYSSQSNDDDEEEQKTRTIIDGVGREVTIPSNVTRVISLVSGITQIFYEIGAEDTLVGVPQALPYPTYYYVPESINVTNVGGIASISLETVSSLHPDVVFTTEFYLSSASALIEQGISVVAIRLDDIADVTWNIRLIGSIVGMTESAEEVADTIEANIASIAANTSSLTSASVYVESYTSAKTYGSASWCTEAIMDAGGWNIYGNSSVKMPSPSNEYVINEDPDFILLYLVAKNHTDFVEKAQAAVADVSNRTGWSDIEAVKNGNICVIENRCLNFGTSFDDGVAEIAMFLHPELSGELAFMSEYSDYAYIANEH